MYNIVHEKIGTIKKLLTKTYYIVPFLRTIFIETPIVCHINSQNILLSSIPFPYLSSILMGRDKAIDCFILNTKSPSPFDSKLPSAIDSTDKISI